MQTFLPFDDFERTVACLDWRRLGKQRVEAFQILKALTLPSYGWQNHPAVKMWRGYEDALGVYMNCCITEWKRRGYKNTMTLTAPCPKVRLPPWLGSRRFHESHRSNLVRKDPEHYRQFFPRVAVDLPYIWPV
jgi:hypothetical protein